MQIPSSLNLKQFLTFNAGTERDSQRLGDGQQKLLENLRPKSISQSGSSSRKSAAAAKIAELKMRLDAMLKFAGIGKGSPAAAISLAKELAAAVRAYGGSSGASEVNTPQFNITPTSAATTDAAATTGDAASSTAQAATVASVASAASISETGSRAEVKAAEQSAKAVLAQAATSPTVNLNSEKGLSAGDSKFLAEAKSLMQQIKMLIKLETKKAEDEKKAQAAINEMNKALEDAPAAIAQSNLAEATTEYSATGESMASVTEASSVSISV